MGNVFSAVAHRFASVRATFFSAFLPVPVREVRRDGLLAEPQGGDAEAAAEHRSTMCQGGRTGGVYPDDVRYCLERSHSI